MCTQHTTACAQCPWRRTSLPGWLGGTSPEEFMEQANAEIKMPCHIHVDYDREDWEEQIETAPRCAGHAIFLKNRCKLPRETGLRAFVEAVQRDTDTIFQWPHEFIAYHSGGIK